MLTETLKIKIIKYLADYTNAEDWGFVGEKIESTDCNVYRLSSLYYPKDIALKIYHLDKTKKKFKHYSVVERYSKLLNKPESRYRVPKAIGFFPEDNCFLMEWVSGLSLKDKLWKNCFSKNNIQAYIKETCHWLKHYHQQAGLEMKLVDTSRYLSNIKEHGFNSDVNHNVIFKSGVETLTKFEKMIIGFEALHSDVHGDLNLSNIIIGDDHVTGIDIGGIKNLPVEDDLAQLLNYLCVNYFNMLTRFDIRKPQETWEIFNVVLDAYDYPKDNKSRDFFLFVFMYQMLYRWISISNIHNPGREKTLVFFFLGKWRLYNSALIVKELTKLINQKFLDFKNAA